MILGSKLGTSLRKNEMHHLKNKKLTSQAANGLEILT